jgi:hypothetical protein
MLACGSILRCILAVTTSLFGFGFAVAPLCRFQLSYSIKGIPNIHLIATRKYFVIYGRGLA